MNLKNENFTKFENINIHLNKIMEMISGNKLSEALEFLINSRIDNALKDKIRNLRAILIDNKDKEGTLFYDEKLGSLINFSLLGLANNNLDDYNKLDSLVHKKPEKKKFTDKDIRVGSVSDLDIFKNEFHNLEIYGNFDEKFPPLNISFLEEKKIQFSSTLNQVEKFLYTGKTKEAFEKLKENKIFPEIKNLVVGLESIYEKLKKESTTGTINFQFESKVSNTIIRYLLRILETITPKNIKENELSKQKDTRIGIEEVKVNLEKKDLAPKNKIFEFKEIHPENIDQNIFSNEELAIIFSQIEQRNLAELFKYLIDLIKQKPQSESLKNLNNNLILLSSSFNEFLKNKEDKSIGAYNLKISENKIIESIELMLEIEGVTKKNLKEEYISKSSINKAFRQGDLGRVLFYLNHLTKSEYVNESRLLSARYFNDISDEAKRNINDNQATRLFCQKIYSISELLKKMKLMDNENLVDENNLGPGKYKIEEYLKQADLESLFDYIFTIPEVNNDDDLCTSLRTLAARYFRLKEKETRGSVSFNDLNISNNQLIGAILSTIDNIQWEGKGQDLEIPGHSLDKGKLSNYLDQKNFQVFFEDIFRTKEVINDKEIQKQLIHNNFSYNNVEKAKKNENIPNDMYNQNLNRIKYSLDHILEELD